MTSAKQVFVSHASEDKDRFVLPLAVELRAQGVDAWVDKWEMVAGDSLVQKIFVAGLDQSDGVIAVLSAHSVSKPWVKEELDSAVVKRINEGSLLIPIVLDDLLIEDLPPSIRHLLHVRVAEVEDVTSVAGQVVQALYRQTDKPELGTPPAFTSLDARGVGSLDRLGSLVLKALGDRAVEDWTMHFRTQELQGEVTATLGCSVDDWLDSLEVLDADRLIKIRRTMGPRPGNMNSFSLTAAGLRAYARSYVDRYDELEQRVLMTLANWPTDGGTVGELSQQADCPGLLTEQIVERLAARKLLLLSRAVGGGPHRRHWMNVSIKVRRMAAD